MWETLANLRPGHCHGAQRSPSCLLHRLHTLGFALFLVYPRGVHAILFWWKDLVSLSPIMRASCPSVSLPISQPSLQPLPLSAQALTPCPTHTLSLSFPETFSQPPFSSPLSIESGFRHVEPTKYEPRLLHFCGTRVSILLNVQYCNPLLFRCWFNFGNFGASVFYLN